MIGGVSNRKQQKNMSFPATSFTLSIGSPGVDITYGSATRSGNTVMYSAPSPQADLDGRPTIRVSHERTKGKIVKTLIQLTRPFFDADRDVYDGYETINMTYIRKGGISLADGKKSLETMRKFLALAGVEDGIVEATI